MAYKRTFGIEEKKQYAAQQEQRKKELQEKIISLGDSFELNPETLTDYLAFAGKFYQYSAGNNALIYAQNKYAQFCGSFKFFQDRGYTVTSGKNSSLKILVPVKVTLFKVGENEWKQISEATPAEKAKLKQNEYEIRQIQKYKIGSVFDISQTNVPPEEYPKFFSVGFSSEEHHAVYEGVKNYCENELHCPVDLAHFDSISLAGHYLPLQNKIELNDRLKDSRKLETLLHEMGHAIQHDPNTISDRALEQIEFEADSIAVMFQSNFGFEFTEQGQHHLASQYKEMQAANKKQIEAAEDSRSESTEKFNINKILENVCNTYYQHIDKLSDYVKVSLIKDRASSIQTRFRDKNGDFVKSIDEIAKLTLEDANNYYENGKLYVLEGEVKPFVCTRWQENGDNHIRFDAIYETEKGMNHLYGVPERMGTFLPGVATKGSAIIRFDESEQTANVIEAYCNKITDHNLEKTEMDFTI